MGECTGEPFDQRYLGCYISRWGACATQEECEGSGYCSDRDFTIFVHSDEYPVDVQVSYFSYSSFVIVSLFLTFSLSKYGACMSSGEYVSTLNPYCQPPFERTGTGCRSPLITNSADCVPFTNPFVFWLWMEPANTEEECLAKVPTKYGCQIYGLDEDVILWILDEESCNCRGMLLIGFIFEES